jgi:hypothetical protein
VFKLGVRVCVLECCGLIPIDCFWNLSSDTFHDSKKWDTTKAHYY